MFAAKPKPKNFKSQLSYTQATAEHQKTKLNLTHTQTRGST